MASEPQVNVREETILEQLGGAVDAIQITTDLAEAIAQELNETHRTAMKEKARSSALDRERVCNPRLEGRTVRYNLQKYFAALAQMRGEGGWRPYVDEFRTALVELSRAA